MSGASAFGSASCGTFNSSTMIVMMTAITPSLNASSRPLFMREPPDLQAFGAVKLHRSASVLIAAEYVPDIWLVQAGQPRRNGIRGTRAFFFAGDTARRGIQCEAGGPWGKNPVTTLTGKKTAPLRCSTYPSWC